MYEIDWSQFIPNLIVAIVGIVLTLIVGGVISYFKFERFKKWVKQISNRLFIALKWSIRRKWHVILFFGIFTALDITILRVYADWKIVAFSLAHFVIGLFIYRLWVTPSPLLKRNKSLASGPKFLPISLSQGIGNAYLKDRYLDPPLGDVVLDGVKFQFPPDSLIFDTNSHIRSFFPIADGGKEIVFRLPNPVSNVKSAYFLINSGNSKEFYASEKIGVISLLFNDAPPIVTELILGQNIREWCLGNPGDWVRETSSALSTLVWTGTNKQGANAVIDCLEIPIFECMRSNALEKIILIYKPTHRPTDTMGVHFSVFAISLEIEQPLI